MLSVNTHAILDTDLASLVHFLPLVVHPTPAVSIMFPSLHCALLPVSPLMCLFQEEDDYDVMQDPEFLQSVLENLPGVDPNNEAIRNAMGSLASQATKDGKKDKKEEDKK